MIAAIKKGKVEVVKLLLDAGGDPNYQVPDTGNTPLHDAVKQLKLKMSKMMMEIIRLLLLKGADSSIKNNQQKNVYDYAEKVLTEFKKVEDEVKEQLLLEQQKVVVIEQLNDEIQLGSLMERAYSLFDKYEEESEEEESFENEGEIHGSLTE